MTVDVHDSVLRIDTADGDRRELALDNTTIAAFYQQLVAAMGALGIPVSISTLPSEMVGAIAFEDDERVLAYVPAHARALHSALVHADRVMTRFRADFLGKASPINFFWGSFGLATARFSGRHAPPHPGGLPNFPVEVAAEAYSHELTSAGFYPGNLEAPEPYFYSYAYPTPNGIDTTNLQCAEARFDADLGEFVLPYDAVADAEDSDATLLGFFDDVHSAAARLADWDTKLHCAYPRGPEWWRNRT